MKNAKAVVRLAKAWMFARFGKIRPVILAHIVTYKCNMRCRYCEYWRYRVEEMPWREIEKMLREAAELGIAVYTATGGEPLLWKHTSSTLTKARDLGFYTMLATNGLLLKGKKLDADMISVSLDTLKRDRYKSVTGVDALERVKEAIIWASERYDVCLNAVLYGENVDEIENLVRFADECGVYITFEPVSPYFEGCPSLSKGEMREAAGRILELKKEFKNILNTRCYLELVRSGGRFRCLSNLLVRVNPDGEVVSPCYELDYIRAGDVREGLKNVIKSENYMKGVEMAKSCSRSCYLLCYAEPSLIFSNLRCTLGFLKETLERSVRSPRKRQQR